MASNIGTNSTFATSNMKPASGEQADALWAQNMGDNLGFLYHREIQLPVDSNGWVFGFRKTPSHNAIKFFGVSTDAVAGVGTIQVYPCGTQKISANRISQQVHSVPAAAFTPNVYMMDLSGLTNGSYYDILWTSNEDQAISAYAIHGTLATY